MPRLLVTGGAGFIGSNFVHYWLNENPGDRIVVLDALTYAGNLENLETLDSHQEYRFVRGDIRDQELVESLLRSERLDTIVHFAAESHVDRSITGPDAFVDVNIGGTHALLKAASAVWLAESQSGPLPHRFHQVSTDEVYGSLNADDPPFRETTAYAPNSPYAASKAAADHLVRAYHETYGLQTTISNCSNNYGPYHYPEKLLPLCILNLLLGKELPIYGDGTNVRDWLYVEDHCRGIAAVLKRGAEGRTYNLGGNCEKTNLDLVRQLCRLVDEAFAKDTELTDRFPAAPAAAGEQAANRITFVKDRPGHDRRYAVDARRAEQELGFSPQVSLTDGLRRTLRWYLDNERWWRRLLDGSYRQWVGQQYDDD